MILGRLDEGCIPLGSSRGVFGDNRAEPRDDLVSIPASGDLGESGHGGMKLGPWCVPEPYATNRLVRSGLGCLGIEIELFHALLTGTRTNEPHLHVPVGL